MDAPSFFFLHSDSEFPLQQIPYNPLYHYDSGCNLNINIPITHTDFPSSFRQIFDCVTEHVPEIHGCPIKHNRMIQKRLPDFPFEQCYTGSCPSAPGTIISG